MMFKKKNRTIMTRIFNVRVPMEIKRVQQTHTVTIISSKEILIQDGGLGEVRVVFPIDYPFEPPRVWVNGETMARFRHLPSVPFQEMYVRLFHECPCCMSILCHERWFPGITLKNILEELREFKARKRQIVKTVLIGQTSEDLLDSVLDFMFVL